MKEIRPEDLSINPRFIGENQSSAKQSPAGNDTSLNCYTGPPCDTVDNCHTSELLCNTGTDCEETADCLETKYCQTSACGDTRTQAVICCPVSTGSVCVVYTKACRDTELCLEPISSDLACKVTDFCSTDDDCKVSLDCVIGPTIIGG